MTVAESIISTMRKNGKRFYACDNISEYLNEQTINSLIDEATLKFKDVLETLLIDVENDPNSNDTARRLAKMYFNEIMSGRYYPEPKITAFPNGEDGDPYSGMLVVRAEITSLCSHHHQTVKGVAYIGILPKEKVLGLSKYVRIAQHLARRGTLQEELCQSIRKAISNRTGTDDVAVYIEATHGCVENRGVEAHNSLTQTISLGGVFMTDIRNKEEFFHNIQLQSMASNRR